MQHKISNMTYPIDIVIPWVDGSDPEWKKEHDKYAKDASRLQDDSAARYREWGLFKYWFRMIEANAPFVRNVHLLTCGSIPAWLNTNNQKLCVVNHKDFIPEKYLPTFSSHTIELNMHRIPNLAEHFIYFNDDVYLCNKAKAEDFFVNGVPVDRAILGIVKNSDTSNYMPYIMLNMLALINMNYEKHEVMKLNFKKWISPQYGRYILNNMYLYPWKEFTGFRNFHTAVAYQKSTLQQTWDKYPEILDRTCMNKFRSKEDVNQYIFRYTQLVEGNFIPGKNNSSYVTIGSVDKDEMDELLKNKRNTIVCINDDPMGFDFESEQKKIISVMDGLYPYKSSFEI